MGYKVNAITGKLDKVLSDADVAAIADLLYLKLDQTTPQTVTNGIPILEDGIAIGNSSCKFVLVGNTLSLYVDGVKVQDWTATATVSFIMLEQGGALLQENGDPLLKEA